MQRKIRRTEWKSRNTNSCLKYRSRKKRNWLIIKNQSLWKRNWSHFWRELAIKEDRGRLSLLRIHSFDFNNIESKNQYTNTDDSKINFVRKRYAASKNSWTFGDATSSFFSSGFDEVSDSISFYREFHSTFSTSSSFFSSWTSSYGGSILIEYCFITF